jgi:hypothetical protein
MKRALAFLALAVLMCGVTIAVRYTIALAQTGGPYGSPFGTAVRALGQDAVERKER